MLGISSPSLEYYSSAAHNLSLREDPLDGDRSPMHHYIHIDHSPVIYGKTIPNLFQTHAMSLLGGSVVMGSES